MLENHLKILSENLDLFSLSYGQIILCEDFIVGMEDQKMKPFFKNYSLKSLVRQ